eukprot:GHVO01065460.1.p1 GENE.GHVO01065460.1~~GHVO01065460.1.p1  ORF type:complete len:339 (+),score=21.70 GHVO01065460.1:142-1158(+)
MLALFAKKIILRQIHGKIRADGLFKEPISYEQLAHTAKHIYDSAMEHEQRDINITHVLQGILADHRVVVDVAPDVMVVVGMTQPSIGSCLHHAGLCKPCVFANKAHKSCRSGHLCLFCHYVHKERRRRKKHGKGSTPVQSVVQVSHPPNNVHAVFDGSRILRNSIESVSSSVLPMCGSEDTEEDTEWKDFLMSNEEIFRGLNDGCNADETDGASADIWPLEQALDYFITQPQIGSNDEDCLTLSPLVGNIQPALSQSMHEPLLLPTLCSRRDSFRNNATWTMKGNSPPSSQQEGPHSMCDEIEEDGSQQCNGNPDAAVLNLCERILSLLTSQQDGWNN